MTMPEADYELVETRRGVRLEQNGAALSELCREAGATDSVFDVLAAAAFVLCPEKPLALLGFAGGGMVAPLRAMGGAQTIDAVDLDNRGHEIFQEYARDYAGDVNFHQGDALAWLDGLSATYDLIMDDLSIPTEDDVVKPEISRTRLPGVIRRRLAAGGSMVTNVLSEAGRTWAEVTEPVIEGYSKAHAVILEDFANRIVLAGEHPHDARSLSHALRRALRGIGSSQAEAMRVATLIG